MQSGDAVEFAKVMTLLFETFDREPSKVLTDVYFNALADLSLEDVRMAASRAIQSCRFFPKPVELRGLVQGSPDDRAIRAWELLLQANRVAGHYASVWIEDPLLVRAIVATFGGWVQATEALHVLSDEMVANKRKEFMAIYLSASRLPVGRVEHYLPGSHEVTNQQSVAGWIRGLYPSGTFQQPVGIVSQTGVRTVLLAYSAYTAQLTEESHRLLTEGRYAEAEPPQRLDQEQPAKQLGAGEPVTLDAAIAETPGALQEALRRLRERLQAGRSNGWRNSGDGQ